MSWSHQRFFVPFILLFLIAFSVSAEEITSCGQNLIQNHDYTLNKLISTGGTCLIVEPGDVNVRITGGAACRITFGTHDNDRGVFVQAENFTFTDCVIESPAGSGVGKRGIDIENADNVNLTNLRISVAGAGFSFGVESTSTNNTVFDQLNLTVSSTNSEALKIRYAHNVNVSNSSAKVIGAYSSGSYDLEMLQVEDITIRNSTFGSSEDTGSSETYAAYLREATNCLLYNNTFAKKNINTYLLYLADSSFNTIENSTFIYSTTTNPNYYAITLNRHDLIFGGSKNNTLQNLLINQTRSSRTRGAIFASVLSLGNVYSNISVSGLDYDGHFSLSDYDRLYSANLYLNGSDDGPPEPIGWVKLNNFMQYSQQYPAQGGVLKLYFTEDDLIANNVNRNSVRIFKNTGGWTNESFYNPSYYGVSAKDYYAYANITDTASSPEFGLFGQEPYAPLTDCQSVYFYNRNFTLTSDVNEVMTPGEACFDILTDDAVFDCAGHSVTADGNGYFLRTNGHYNITVKNCNVSNWEVGVVSDGSELVEIKDSIFSDFPNGLSEYTGTAIYTVGLTLNNSVHNVSISGAGNAGARLSWGTSGSKNRFYNNTVSVGETSSDGIRVVGFYTNVSYNNFTVSGVNSNGISLEDSPSESNIHNNYFAVSNGLGIDVASGEYDDIYENNFAVSSGAAARVDADFYSTVFRDNNVILSGSATGVEAMTGNVSYNDISGSTTSYGINMSGSSARIQNNVVDLTTGTAFYFTGSSSIVSNNLLKTSSVSHYCVYEAGGSDNAFYENKLYNSEVTGWEYLSAGAHSNNVFYNTTIGNDTYGNFSEFRTNGGFRMRHWLTPVAHAGYADFERYVYADQTTSDGWALFKQSYSLSNLQSNRVYGIVRKKLWMYSGLSWYDTGYYSEQSGAGGESGFTWTNVTTISNALLALHGKQDCGQVDYSFTMQADIETTEQSCFDFIDSSLFNCNNYRVVRNSYSDGACFNVTPDADSVLLSNCYADGWSYGVYSVLSSPSGGLSLSNMTIYSKTPFYSKNRNTVDISGSDFYGNISTTGLVLLDRAFVITSSTITCMPGVICNYGLRTNYDGTVSGYPIISGLVISKSTVGASLYGSVSVYNTIFDETGNMGTPLLLYKNSAGDYFDGGLIQNVTFINYNSIPLYGQLYIDEARNSIFAQNKFYGNQSTAIYDYQGSNNIFSNNSIYSHSADWAIKVFQSTTISGSDIFTAQLINSSVGSSTPFLTDFYVPSPSTQGRDYKLTATNETPLDDADGYVNITKYFKYVNASDTGEVLLKIYYNEADWQNAGIGLEPTLRLWIYNGSWTQLPSTVNTLNNYVQASLFPTIMMDESSVFAVRGLFGGAASDCGTLTSSIKLVNDVFAEGTCFTIGADDVEIDCDGYAIQYANSQVGYAVNNSLGNDGYENVTVKNCYIQQLGSSYPASHGIYGIWSGNNTIYNNTLIGVSNLSTASLLSYCHNSNMSNNVVLGKWDVGLSISSSDNLIAKNNIVNLYGIWGAEGMSFQGSWHWNATVVNNSINVSVTQLAIGLILTSRDSTLSNNTISLTQTDASASDSSGIDCNNCVNTSFENTVIALNRTASTGYSNGIFIYAGGETTFTNTNITLIGGKTRALYNYDSDVVNLIARNMSIFQNSTNATLSFNANGKLVLGLVSSPAGDPTGYHNIGKYVNITNYSAAWVYLNVSYLDSELFPGFDESSLRLWRYSTSWDNVSGSGVQTADNYVYANVTAFGVVAPMGVYGTSVSTCGTLPDANTVYTLTSNVSAEGTCFTIGASNITLNCNGYTIRYSNSLVGYGVVSDGNSFLLSGCDIYQNNSTLQDSHGVYIQNTQSVNLTKDNILPSGVGSFGVFVANSSRVNLLQLEVNTTASNSHDIAIRDGTFVTVWNSVLSSLGSNASGIYFYPSDVTIVNNSYGLFDNNVVYTNGDSGKGFAISRNADYSIFSSNNITTASAFGHGIYIDSNNLVVLGNIVRTIGGYAHAINVLGVNNISIKENVLNVSSASSGASTLFMQGTTGTEVSYNNMTETVIGGSNHYGLYASGLSNVVFDQNKILMSSVTSSDVAVSFSSSSNTNFTNNVVVSSVLGDALRLDSSSVLASGNSITSTAGNTMLSFTSSNLNGSNNYLQDYVDSSYNLTFYSWNSITNTNLALKKLSLSFTPIPPSGYLKIGRHLPTIYKSGANDSFLEIRMSYLDSELPSGANESEVTLMKLVGGTYYLVPGAFSDPTNNFVYANLSDFVIGADEVYLLVVPGYAFPSVQLISPYDGYVSPFRTINFVCNASAFGNFDLANMTLYGNWSGLFIANDTVALTGRQDDAQFSETMPPFTMVQQDYSWNCYACDTYGNCAFAPANWTISISSSSIANLTAHTTVGGFCDMAIDKESVAFGLLNDGENTGGVNQIINITNSGNMPGNLSIKASRFENSTHSFAPTNMLFNTSAFTYPAGTAIQLTDTVIANDVMPFLNTSLHLGLGIPLYQQSGDYQSNTTITLIC